MAYENFWPEYRQNTSATGGADGRITVPTTNGLFVRQEVVLTGAVSFTGVVKEVISPTVVRIGPKDGNYPGTAFNLVTSLAGDQLYAPYQQIVYGKLTDVLKASYESEPAKAVRMIQVDEQGIWGQATSSAAFQFLKVSAATMTASLTNSASAFTVGTITNPARMFTVFNNLSTSVAIALNGVEIAELNSGENINWDLAAIGRAINGSTTIGVWNVSTTPSTGSLRFSIVS